MVKIITFALIAINLVFHFSVYNQGQNSKTISTNKNKNMHSLIDNCCETHFNLLCMVSRSFTRHSTTELFFSTLKKPSKKYTCFIMRRFEETFFEHFFSVDETVKSFPVFCS